MQFIFPLISFLGNGLGIVTMEKVGRRRKGKQREESSDGKAVDVFLHFCLSERNLITT